MRSSNNRVQILKCEAQRTKHEEKITKNKAWSAKSRI
jgi:hypothetical protein